MSPKKQVNTPKAIQPAGAYSQGIIANGFLLTAGFGPIHPETGAQPEGIYEQTRQSLYNIAQVLAEAGLDFSDVVKATVHLEHLHRDFTEFDRAYSEILLDPRPARTTVGSALIAFPIEIDVVAALRE